MRGAQRVLYAALAAVVVGVLGGGCTPASTLYFLFRGDGKQPAEYPLTPKEGKNSVSVAVLVTAPAAGWEFAAIDRELATAVARKFTELTKDGKAPIKVLDPAKIDKFKATTPDWKALSSAELGKQLGADYVIDVTLANMTLYEPGTGKLMYMGTATVEATATDAATGKVLGSYYANPRLDSRPAGDIPPAQYKSKLVERMADEISWKHVAHARRGNLQGPQP
jgi:hypothetical protein